MTHSPVQLPPFIPPPVSTDPRQVIFQPGLHSLPANALVQRLRDFGLEAVSERERDSHLQPQSSGMYLFAVYVARPHYLCALIIWRLRGRGPEAWNTMARNSRRTVAVQALVDGALAGDCGWPPDLFQKQELDWLRVQLGMRPDQFDRLLVEARDRSVHIGRRDLRWGLWITLVCLGGGALWGWAVSFVLWPVWVLLVLGFVVGVFTLANSLPRVMRMDRSPDAPGEFSPPLTPEQGAERPCTSGVDGSPPAAQAGPPPPAHHTLSADGKPYLDWVSALRRGEELLQSGRTEESIAYFKRSLLANPGEAGTASGEDAARRGIQAAEAILERRMRKSPR